tara:strand:+ start:13671 stop:15041 length:1371 start_codon:yes stop_codon:yes gene_type:complete
MKESTIIFFFALTISINAQQKLAFSFGETPQTLLLNPGAETNFKRHYGIPILSNFNLSAGNSGFELADLFLNDSRDFNSKFQEILTKISNDDYVNINAVIDIINGGFRIDEKTYISFGFYQELDIISYFPKDMLELFYYGNEPFLNRPFSISQASIKGDFSGILHLGVSKKVNTKLNFGARLKIYSSSINVESTNNSGTFTTSLGNNNILSQSLNNVDAQVRTSGILDSNNEVFESINELFTNTFFGNNLGLGVDLGLTYHFSPQLEFTGSLLDIGFVKYSKKIRNFSTKGNYVLDGINFEYNSSSPVDYWEELENDFKAKVPSKETQEAYTSWRPMKINTALKYSFGEKRSVVCYAETHKKYFHNSIGLQLHSIMRPLKAQFSFTSFYERSLSKNTHLKFTHTMNDYSPTIFGTGLSLQVSRVHFFGLLDNIFAVRDLSTANNISVNFGFNIVID